MLWDADARNLLAINPDKRHNRVITPHPGEGGPPVRCSVAEIESDRYFQSTAVWQNGTRRGRVKSRERLLPLNTTSAIIDAGNAGMASGGMGDVLSGIIGALLGQKLPRMMRHVCGWAHGAAADLRWQRVMALARLLATIYYAAAYC